MRSRFLPSIMTAPLVVVCLTLVSFSASAISTADKIRDKYVDDVCDESTHMKVTNLSCVSCGMQKFLSHGKSSEQRKALTPSEKYLSLLGYATNRFTSLGSTVTGNIKRENVPADGGAALRMFQQSVIQKVQAYGFCLNDGTDANGNLLLSKGYGKVTNALGEKSKRELLPLIHLAITGNRAGLSPTTDGKRIVGASSNTGFTSAEEADMVRYFGFKDYESFKSIFAVDDFATLTPGERQDRLRIQLAGTSSNSANIATGSGARSIIKSGDTGEALTECLRQMNSLQTAEKSAFNLKQVENPRNQELCQLMAVECNMDNVSFCSETPKIRTQIQSTTPRENTNLLDAAK